MRKPIRSSMRTSRRRRTGRYEEPLIEEAMRTLRLHLQPGTRYVMPAIRWRGRWMQIEDRSTAHRTYLTAGEARSAAQQALIYAVHGDRAHDECHYRLASPAATPRPSP